MDWTIKGFCRSCRKRYLYKPSETCQEQRHSSYYFKISKSSEAILQRKLRHDKARLDALLHYGGKCACCGFSDLTQMLFGASFLQIDHIKGGGGVHIRAIQKSFTSFYHWLRNQNYPEGYRVLCKGCNAAMKPGAEKCLLHGGI